MSEDAEDQKPGQSQTVADPERPVPSPAARRALAEAQVRRTAARLPRPSEIDGRGGLEPVRYGDWEVKGLASDF